jgi:hypothetical protein
MLICCNRALRELERELLPINAIWLELSVRRLDKCWAPSWAAFVGRRAGRLGLQDQKLKAIQTPPWLWHALAVVFIAICASYMSCLWDHHRQATSGSCPDSSF